MPGAKIADKLAIILYFFLVSCSSTKQATEGVNTLPASSLQPFGRYALNEQGLELISSAVHFGFSFSGTECRVFAHLSNNAGHNYLQYELDGEYQKKLKVEGSSNAPITITASGNGKHTVWIYKNTEAQTGPIFINKIEATNVKSLKSPDVPLIEFIGNSITCGAAADASETPCGQGEYHDHHNAYYAYGPRVSRALGVNYIVSSVSGIGVYRNWNSDGPAMPEVYEKTGLTASDSRLWDFALYKPAIVSIALGTNDFSNGDGKKPRLPFDSATFVSTYTKFVQLVKSKYRTAQIVLLGSPMMNGSRRLALHSYIAAVKSNIDALYPSDKPVNLFFFDPIQPKGCTGHPNVEDHAVLANQLYPFFKKLL